MREGARGERENGADEKGREADGGRESGIERGSAGREVGGGGERRRIRAEKGRGGSEGTRKERRKGRGRRFGPIYSIYLHIPSCTFLYLYIPSYTPKCCHIHSYTRIYLKIFNIRKMKANIKHKNGHNSTPRESPRIRTWPKASYHVSRGSNTPKEIPKSSKSPVLKDFGRVT